MNDVERRILEQSCTGKVFGLKWSHGHGGRFNSRHVG